MYVLFSGVGSYHRCDACINEVPSQCIESKGKCREAFLKSLAVTVAYVLNISFGNLQSPGQSSSSIFGVLEL